MGIVIGLFAAAIGILVGLVGGLAGIGVGILGGAFGLLAHLLPIILIVAGIIWLVKGSSRGSISAAKTRQGQAAPTPAPRRLP
jgi:predicted lipid-binding transport protein (Tim44 family)